MAVLLWLFSIYMIINRYGEFKNWNFSMILFVVALFSISWSLASMICIHLSSLVTEVRNGNYTNYMLKPTSSLFFYCASQFPIRTIGDFLSSLILLVWSITIIPIDFSVMDILFLTISVIGGIATISGSFIINGSMAFLNIDTSMSFVNIFSKLRDMSRFPLFIYPEYLQGFLLSIVPYGLVAYYPISSIIFEKKRTILLYFTPCIGFGYLALSIILWKYMEKKYEATGS
ncbi:Uncharacterized protein BTT61001_02870 [Bacillus thuringiensis]|uniref:ABC transporter permease n=1 Tax=Bacillus thuringiensis TaxID=1428 RepID=A0A1C4E434_BACTU|nr:Uncharacterized protein BTT61001_02870 [Bacillus thuringiensis]